MSSISTGPNGGGGGGGMNVQFLTGNIGGPVGPDGAGNINTIGAGNIFVTGNPGINTLTYTLVGTTNHAVQIGNAAGSLTSLAVANNGQLVIGSTGADPVVASMTNGNNITWTGGAGSLRADVTGTTNHSLLLGNATGSINNLGVAINGQLPIGSAGANPVLATLTPGAGVSIANGAGSITISADTAVVVTTLHTQDGHNVTPTAGVINIVGNNGITTAGTVGPNTVTISNDGTLSNSFPTDSGTATPAAGILNIITDNAAVNAGSSVLFSAPGASNTVQLNVTDANSNTLVGLDCGNLTLSGTNNTGLGKFVLNSLTTGHDNIAVGLSAMRDCTTGHGNLAIGVGALQHTTDGINNVAYGTGALQTNVHGSAQTAIGSTCMQNFNDAGSPGNVALGSGCLNALTSGEANTAMGFSAGSTLLTGTYNCLLGVVAGSNYVGAESSNILLMNAGVAAENNTIRIGTNGTGNGQQNILYLGAPRTEASDFAQAPRIMTINSTGAQTGRVEVTGSALASWQVVTGAFTFTSGMGIAQNGGGLCTLPLPVVSIVGDTITLTDMSGNGWKITQAAGQQIRLGATTTTLGATGFLQSNSIGDTVTIVCVVANTTWQVISVIGNITVN